MNAGQASRPVAATLCLLVAVVAAVAHLALIDLPMVAQGNISPLGCALFWVPLFIGFAGVWAMRWWGVAVVIVTALCIAFFYALGRAVATEVTVAVIIIATLIPVLMYRGQYR